MLHSSKIFAALIALLPQIAPAAIFTFSYTPSTGGGTSATQLTLEVSDQAIHYGSGVAVGYSILSATGTIDNKPVSLVFNPSPGSLSVVNGNAYDNIINGDPSYVSKMLLTDGYLFYGFGWSGSSGNSDTYSYTDTPNGANFSLGYGKSTLQASAAVPEPASWAMMIGGFGMIGGAMRRRKVAVSFG